MAKCSVALPRCEVVNDVLRGHTGDTGNHGPGASSGRARPAVNMFGTKTVLLVSVIAFLGGRPDFLDLALAYALINFIGVFAVLEFFRSRAVRRAAETGASDT